MKAGNGSSFHRTKEGGLAVYLINKTGAPSVKGTVVTAFGSVDESFDVALVSDAQPIGIVYNSGVADGGKTLVVISGKAEVLLEDTTASTRGYWVATSTTQAGRADATLAVPPGGGIPELDRHMAEIGHCLESKNAGTNVLAKCIIHFN